MSCVAFGFESLNIVHREQHPNITGCLSLSLQAKLASNEIQSSKDGLHNRMAEEWIPRGDATNGKLNIMRR